MNLTNYQSICPELNTSKAIRTNNADTSADTKLVLGSNGYKDNYGFLLFPVDPLKTANDDYYYVVHAQSGYVIAPKDESQEDGDKLVLTRFDGSSDQQWSFLNFDEAGNPNIVSRSTGYVWKVKNGDTSDGTNIVVHSSSGNTNSFFEFDEQPDSDDTSKYKTIPNPDLVGYINNTGQSLDDKSYIPQPTEDGSNYENTNPVLIGECSISFCTFDVYINSSSSDPNSTISNLGDRTFADQANETPYYVFQRSQYWQSLKDKGGMITIPANEPYTKDFDVTYGADDNTLSTFSSQTDWELESDLTISYGPASTGMSASIDQATLINSATSGIEYSQSTETIPMDYEAVSYERVLYVWQTVDQLQIVDGRGVVISTLDIPGKTTYVTEYDA